MWNRAGVGVIVAMLAAGCAAPASSPVAVQAPLPGGAVTWLDAEFRHDPALVAVTPANLFKLDPSLQQRLDDPSIRAAPVGLRLKRILDTIFGVDRKGFAYRAGHSTTAAETWRSRGGDCLSLTVMTYSVARTLGMSANMQEVQTPAIFGRAGELDVVNQHVNVVFPHIRGDLFVESVAHEVVIDFEPDFSAPRRGTPLTEAGIVARYYNNVAVEHMARGDDAVAYAHFRAAVRADPTYVSPYSNLAVLYRRFGYEKPAEDLLRHAIATGGGATDVALHELHRLLKDQGRTAEATEVALRLEARQASDPYHWISLALLDLQQDSPRRAIERLERAKEIAPGFAEVHRYLALAYGRTGNVLKAREELAALENLGGAMNKVALLRRKLERLEGAAH